MIYPRPSIWILVALFCAFLAPAVAQDDVARSLQLTTTSGSLPLWTKPSQAAKQELGEFVRSAHGGVVLVGHPKYGRGTAWVVSRKHRLLVTNAHVADILHEAGGTMFGVINGTANICKVTRAWYHPGVRRQFSGGAVLRSENPADGQVDPNCPDVAILQLAEGEDLPVELTMADPKVFSKLLAQPCAILGYPGHDTQSWPQLGETAEATFHDGAVSRFTNFRNSVSAPVAERQFVQYTMATWGGFSGSPVFLPSGEVLAIHNSAAYLKGDAGDVRAIPHGIRIDCLWELVAHHGLDDRIPLPVDKAALNVQRWLEQDDEEIALRKAIALVAEAQTLIYDKEQFAEGVQKCTEAIQLAPEYAEAYHDRSNGYTNYWFKFRRQIDRELAYRQLDNAERDARKYAQLDPTNPYAILAIATTLNNRGHFSDQDSYNEQVLRLIEKLLESDNISNRVRAFAYSKRAVAYHNLDQSDEALRDHNEAVRLEPKEPILYETRADFWHYERRSDLEERDYATARRLRGQ